MSRQARTGLTIGMIALALIAGSQVAGGLTGSAEAKGIIVDVTFAESDAAGEGTVLEGVGTSPSAQGLGAFVTVAGSTPPPASDGGISIFVQMAGQGEVEFVDVSIGEGFVVD